MLLLCTCCAHLKLGKRHTRCEEAQDQRLEARPGVRKAAAMEEQRLHIRF
jgi:hypothetical protein